MKNENGGALLLVLLTITLLSIFSLGLLYQVQTSSKQFNKTEKQVQATNIAKMGLQHVREIVTENRLYLPLNVSAARSELRDSFLTTSLNQSIINSSSNANYSVSVDYLPVKGNYFEIVVKSKGTVKNEIEIREEKLRFTLTGGWKYLEELEPFEKLKNYNQNPRDQYKKNNSKIETCVSSQDINRNILLASIASYPLYSKNNGNGNNGQGNSRGNNGNGNNGKDNYEDNEKGISNGMTEYECQSNQQFTSDRFVQIMNGVKVTINGNLVLRNGLQMKNKSLLIVNGDFHSGNDLSRKNVSGNKGTIIVNGHAYLPEKNLNMNNAKVCITGSTNFLNTVTLNKDNPLVIKGKGNKNDVELNSCADFEEYVNNPHYQIPPAVYVTNELGQGMSWRVNTEE
ncbi:hypothetical protein [Pontibacillus salipaludis]|uniref:hypothetical protein n=1 Tax=Pontibacillus salipaludis TaxID=1697394 RepID=UPI0031E627D8